jgi:hypothetical protein
VNARAISEIFGHSSVSFTLPMYGHLLAETRREAADKMNAALTLSEPVAPHVAGTKPN